MVLTLPARAQASNLQARPAANRFTGRVARNARIISINVFLAARSWGRLRKHFLSNGLRAGDFHPTSRKGLERVYALRNTYSIASLNMSLGGGLFTGTCDNERPSTTTLVNMLASAGIATVVRSRQ